MSSAATFLSAAYLPSRLTRKHHHLSKKGAAIGRNCQLRSREDQSAKLEWNPLLRACNNGCCPSLHRCLKSLQGRPDHLAATSIQSAANTPASTLHCHECLPCSWCSSRPEAQGRVSKTFSYYCYYIPVFLEEGIVVVAAEVFSVQLHVIKTVGVLARIGKEFLLQGVSHFFPQLVLLLFEELHLLLFTYFLLLGPMSGLLTCVLTF
jgi:hypothetical protein